MKFTTDIHCRWWCPLLTESKPLTDSGERGSSPECACGNIKVDARLGTRRRWWHMPGNSVKGEQDVPA